LAPQKRSGLTRYMGSNIVAVAAVASPDFPTNVCYVPSRQVKTLVQHVYMHDLQSCETTAAGLHNRMYGIKLSYMLCMPDMTSALLFIACG